jgi:hypothetical protein
MRCLPLLLRRTGAREVEGPQGPGSTSRFGLQIANASVHPEVLDTALQRVLSIGAYLVHSSCLIAGRVLCTVAATKILNLHRTEPKVATATGSCRLAAFIETDCRSPGLLEGLLCDRASHIQRAHCGSWSASFRGLVLFLARAQAETSKIQEPITPDCFTTVLTASVARKCHH